MVGYLRISEVVQNTLQYKKKKTMAGGVTIAGFTKSPLIATVLTYNLLGQINS